MQMFQSILLCPKKLSLVLMIAAWALVSCTDTGEEGIDEQAEKPTPMEIQIPSNFPAPVYDLQRNPVTEEGFLLGKKLFYESKLSRDNTISCGFCHMQPVAFTHHGHDVSHGIDDKLGRRNALPVQNMLFSRNFFWDGGVHDLDLVPVNAITSEVEMDESVDNILVKLRADAQYREMFKKAYGSDTITSVGLLKSLSQFMVAVVSANSRYDKYVRNEPGASLTTEELQGMQLFRSKCATCHATDLFTDESYRNNGFSSPEDLVTDKGREEVTLRTEDRGKFKVPSLRNVEYTAPYMHHGKLPSLEAVMHRYATGVFDAPNLDPLLRTPAGPRIPMTPDEQRKIIAFLKTLTDQAFLEDRRFSEF